MLQRIMISLKGLTSLVGSVLIFTLPSSSSLKLDESINYSVGQDSSPDEDIELVSKETKTWKGKNFTESETEVLNFLQAYGIEDRAALATILGNIKQESKFDTLVCEGGIRTGYSRCRRGGFGLIQWTTTGRYRGLGNHSAKLGLDPNSLEAQLRWMITEVEWKKIEYVWKTPGKSIDGYMWAAKKWLGWGVHGKRTSYAHQYYNQLHKG